MQTAADNDAIATFTYQSLIRTEAYRRVATDALREQERQIAQRDGQIARLSSTVKASAQQARALAVDLLRLRAESFRDKQAFAQALASKDRELSEQRNDFLATGRQLSGDPEGREALALINTGSIEDAARAVVILERFQKRREAEDTNRLRGRLAAQRREIAKSFLGMYLAKTVSAAQYIEKLEAVRDTGKAATADLIDLAEMYVNVDENENALAASREAVALATTARERGTAYDRLAGSLVAGGNSVEILKARQGAVDSFRQAMKDSGGSIDAMRDLRNGLSSLCSTLAKSDPAKAIEAGQEALQLSMAISRDASFTGADAYFLSVVISNSAEALIAHGNRPAAAESYDRSIKLLEMLFRDRPKSRGSNLIFGEIYSISGLNLAQLGKWDEASERIEKAIILYEENFDQDDKGGKARLGTLNLLYFMAATEPTTGKHGHWPRLLKRIDQVIVEGAIPSMLKVDLPKWRQEAIGHIARASRTP